MKRNKDCVCSFLELTDVFFAVSGLHTARRVILLPLVPALSSVYPTDRPLSCGTCCTVTRSRGFMMQAAGDRVSVR